MAHVAVWAGRGQGAMLLSLIEHAPSSTNEHKTAANEYETEDMEGAKVRVRLPPKERLKEMSCVVRQPIHAGVTALEPAGEEIDSQRKAVHLREQCDEKRAEGYERAPVPLRLRLEEAVGEQDEDCGVNEYKGPKTIS